MKLQTTVWTSSFESPCPPWLKEPWMDGLGTVPPWSVFSGEDRVALGTRRYAAHGWVDVQAHRQALPCRSFLTPQAGKAVRLWGQVTVVSGIDLDAWEHIEHKCVQLLKNHQAIHLWYMHLSGSISCHTQCKLRYTYIYTHTHYSPCANFLLSKCIHLQRIMTEKWLCPC